MVELAIVAAFVAVIWWLKFRDLVKRVESVEDQQAADRLGEIMRLSHQGPPRLYTPDYDPDSIDNAFPVTERERADRQESQAERVRSE